MILSRNRATSRGWETKGYVIPKSIHNQAGLDQGEFRLPRRIARPSFPTLMCRLPSPYRKADPDRRSIALEPLPSAPAISWMTMHAMSRSSSRKTGVFSSGDLTLAGLYVFWPELTGIFRHSKPDPGLGCDPCGLYGRAYERSDCRCSATNAPLP